MYYAKINEDIQDLESSNGRKEPMRGITLDNIDVIETSDFDMIGSSVSSNIIQVEINKDGSVSKRSKIADSTKIEEIIINATEKFTNTIERILNGETSAAPIILSDFNACDFCPYSVVCHIN
jgi:ATP-dependent helicase/nuclease subunit B